MKKISFILSAFAFVFVVSCNNSGNKNAEQGTDAKVKTKADSLMDDIMDGHNFGMGKMSKLSSMEKRVQQAIDSIDKLPGKAKKAAVDYKIDLDSLLTRLKSAEDGMNSWMDGFNMDSAENNIELRIKYLESEKLKVSGVKEKIVTSLQKADSLLKH
ncbi:MAG: viral A-type inclusion protein [Chitinophagales bacterium]